MKEQIFAIFKEGDHVPEYLEKVESKNAIAVFGTDVEVYKRPDGYHVYPTSESDFVESIIKITVTDEQRLILNGGPTVIYAKPYGGKVEVL